MNQIHPDPAATAPLHLGRIGLGQVLGGLAAPAYRAVIPAGVAAAGHARAVMLGVPHGTAGATPPVGGLVVGRC